MKIFGKLTCNRESIVDNITGQSVEVFIFRDSCGHDWLDITRDKPFPYYIAVDDNNIVVAANSDPSHLQLDKHIMIGLSSLDITTEQAIGKYWNGNDIIDVPDFSPNTISKRQFYQYCALQNYITREEAISAMFGSSLPQSLLIIINNSNDNVNDIFGATMMLIGENTISKEHRYVKNALNYLKWDKDQIDSFWLEASKLV